MYSGKTGRFALPTFEFLVVGFAGRSGTVLLSASLSELHIASEDMQEYTND